MLYGWPYSMHTSTILCTLQRDRLAVIARISLSGGSSQRSTSIIGTVCVQYWYSTVSILHCVVLNTPVRQREKWPQPRRAAPFEQTVHLNLFTYARCCSLAVRALERPLRVTPIRWWLQFKDGAQASVNRRAFVE